MITMMLIAMMTIGMLSRVVHIKDSQETGQWPTTTLTLPKRGIFRVFTAIYLIYIYHHITPKQHT